jgi:hypothetical protein
MMKGHASLGIDIPSDRVTLKQLVSSVSFLPFFSSSVAASRLLYSYLPCYLNITAGSFTFKTLLHIHISAT